jgi:hypothetical protein
MKIIQKFEQNQVASTDIQKHQKKCAWNKTAFFYDQDKKINLVSLSFFERLGLFLQKIFCCRSSAKLKIKNFTKISSSELKTILRKVEQPEQPPIQVTRAPSESETVVNQRSETVINRKEETEPGPMVEPVPSNSGPIQINVFQTLKEGVDVLNFPLVKETIKRIEKSIREYDQDDLNKFLYSFYNNTTQLVPIGTLANQYCKNREFDKLNMMVKALENINENLVRIFGNEDSSISNLIEQYKNKFSELEAVPKVTVVTSKKILQEGKAFSGTSQEKITQLAGNIRDIIEKEQWSFRRQDQFDLDSEVIQYIIYALDIEPLIKLTKYFKENNQMQRSERMVEALTRASKQTYLGDQILKLIAFLEELSHS